MSSGCFAYKGFEIDPDAGTLVCHYGLDATVFTEVVAFEGTEGSPAWSTPQAEAAARWVFLLAGISYYKAGAPPLVDLGDLPVSDDDLAFLHRYYVDGLGEFAYRNGLDLTAVELRGKNLEKSLKNSGKIADTPIRPLVPFGGGIDSIVTAELVRRRAGDDNVALFVVSRAGDRFAAIEAPAAVTGLRVIRAERQLDPQILRSGELGYLNGHVPVTGIVSAIAVLAAVLHGRDAVVMSNEASASVGNLVSGGRVVNHQWSKSIDFEEGFRSAAGRERTGVDYFSLLRPASELWVARQFAALTSYHRAFRSCNKAFFVDPARRLDHWCGRCDKCCFVDLVLAPFMARTDLEAVFAGAEPLADKDLAENFRVLLALSSSPKPWDCVGDTAECRAALRLAAARGDRQDDVALQELAAELAAQAPSEEGEAIDASGLAGPHFIPEAYAHGNLLV